MSQLGEDLIQSMRDALAMSRGAPIGRTHSYPTALEVRKRAGLTQAQMAPILGMSLSGYRKVEQGQRPLQGPAANMLRILDKEPEAVKRALLSPMGIE